MTDEEILEKYRRELQRDDFSPEDKRAKRRVTRRLMEKMGIQTCAAGHDSCVNEGTHEYMKDVFMCSTHHNQGRVMAVCARCTQCSVWVVLIGRTANPEPMVYELKCPVETCRSLVLVKSGDTRWIGLPNKIVDKGYFYDREVDEL